MLNNDFMANLRAGTDLISASNFDGRVLDDTQIIKLHEVFGDIELQKKVQSKNIDLLYAKLNYLISTNVEALDSILSSGSTQTDVLHRLVTTVPNKTSLEKLPKHLSSYCKKTNKELLEDFKSKILVEDIDVVESPKQVFFSKLNHGFWEYVLNTYLYDERESFDEKGIRVITNDRRLVGVKKSGFYDEMIFLLGEFYKGNIKNVEFGINLKAGDETIKKSVARGTLSKVQRGALIGMLALHEEFLLVNKKAQYRDGSSPRRMIEENQLGEFCCKFVVGVDDLLIIGSGHLSQGMFPEFKGREHFLVLPQGVVHETWRLALLSSLGVIQRIYQPSKKICVLVQSANFASLLCLYLPLLLSEEQIKNITFFDLGRILDMHDIERIKKWGSFSRILAKYPNGFDEYKMRG